MPVILRNTLHRPHDLNARTDPGYNPVVAADLVSAYQWLKKYSSQPDAFSHAAAIASGCLIPKISARQRMQASYALGMAFIGDGALNSGLQQLDNALDMAKRLSNWGSFVELSYLHASTNTKLLRYNKAADYLGPAIDTLRVSNVARKADYITLEVNMLVTLAMCAFCAEDYATASRSLKEAEVAANELAQPERLLATIFWIRAILCRALDDPESARSLGWKAAEVYSKTETPTDELSWGRLQRELTEFTLDIVEAQTVGQQELDYYLTQAGSWAAQAVQYAHRGKDDIGKGLALLAQARYQRITGRTLEALTTIERALNIGKRTDDLPLQVQAYTALGFTHRARNDTELSLNCFRRSVDMVRFTDIAVMSAPARKELLRAAKDHL